MDRVIENILDGSVNLAFKLLGFVLILFIGFKLVNLATKVVKKNKHISKLDKSVLTFITSFVSITLKTLLLITAFAYIGIPMTSMLALIGSAGVAIGLALQGGLSNIAGGIMLLVFRPFKVGDYISDNSDEGTVEEITIFYTILRTPDNKKVVIPNGTLSNETITNYSAHSKRRLDIDFTVNYESDTEKVIKILKEEINKQEKVLKEEDIFARLTKYGENSLVFTIRIWVKQEDYWAVKFSLLENVKKSFNKNNIIIPYQQIDVHLQK